LGDFLPGLASMFADLKVGPAHDRTRLDVFVSFTLGAEYTRSRVARMIKAGLVTVNGEQSARPSSAVHQGDRIDIADPPPLEPREINPAAPDIEVIFADDEIIVVNKPAGMTVHPAPGHPDATLVDALLARFPELATMAEAGGVLRPGIVHRLDKETSGVMVIARTPFSKAALAAQFKSRTVKKIYLAIVDGIITRDRMTISHALGRHPTDRKRMSIHSHTAREAVSNVIVVERFKEPSAKASLVIVIPETGRTHQIRVHLASMGHPCLGDMVYGGGSKNSRVGDGAEFKRHALHAMYLSIAHPRTLERRTFFAPPPGDFADFLSAHGFDFEHSKIKSKIQALTKEELSGR
jgi:23S rRNA pseudouridine1911/1915/1917 synthase